MNYRRNYSAVLLLCLTKNSDPYFRKADVTVLAGRLTGKALKTSTQIPSFLLAEAFVLTLGPRKVCCILKFSCP